MASGKVVTVLLIALFLSASLNATLYVKVSKYDDL